MRTMGGTRRRAGVRADRGAQMINLEMRSAACGRAGTEQTTHITIEVRMQTIEVEQLIITVSHFQILFLKRDHTGHR